MLEVGFAPTQKKNRPGLWIAADIAGAAENVNGERLAFATGFFHKNDVVQPWVVIDSSDATRGPPEIRNAWKADIARHLLVRPAVLVLLN
jgi:hypothetical protein